MMHRRRGAAIVETKKGILVVEEKNKKFSLPGGGAKKGESREKATIRELHEETGLTTKNIRYLFSYIGHKWHDHKGKSVKNYTKVFLVVTKGVPRPKNEINKIGYWKKGSKLDISGGTKRVIKQYLENKSS